MTLGLASLTQAGGLNVTSAYTPKTSTGWRVLPLPRWNHEEDRLAHVPEVSGSILAVQT